MDSQLVGSYDYRVVLLSIGIAVVGSYAALDLGQQFAPKRQTWPLWLIGPAAMLGVGIWAMHYTGMLSFRLPVPIQYDWLMALLSFVPGLFASIIALVVVSRQRTRWRDILIASLFMGAGISGMHYTAMDSMRMPATCHYSASLVTLSVAFAVVFSFVSLSLTFRSQEDASGSWLRKIARALTMGAAISMMHYTGMAAASFTRSADVPDLSHAIDISILGSIGIGGVTMAILGLVVASSTVNRLHGHKESLRALAARLQNSREDQRTAVAREIHDELGQALTSIKIDVTFLMQDLTQTQQRQRAQALLTLVDRTIQSVRRIATELRPGILDDLGLVAAVEWVTEDFQSRTGITCTIQLPEEDLVVEPKTATAVFRILQETLTNVVRHSQATEVHVRLATPHGDLQLEIRDNGVGSELREIPTGRTLGILGMRERVSLLGGTFEIRSARGAGTTVRVSIPAMLGAGGSS